MSRKAVVLLSGGLDSATALAIARNEGFDCYALSFRYGQRHRLELKAAENIGRSMGVKEHKIIDINLDSFGGSALTDRSIQVPKGRSPDEMAGEIPITYVPARNTIFLSFALAWAEVLNAWDIFIGVNAIDYSGYVDCRPQFIEAFEKLANVATAAAVEGKGQFKIHAPLMYWTKAQIISKGLELGVDYSLTFSCYDPTPDGKACGECDSCILRYRAFRENGIKDPIPYSKEPKL